MPDLVLHAQSGSPARHFRRPRPRRETNPGAMREPIRAEIAHHNSFPPSRTITLPVMKLLASLAR